jgi:hypothetical protein
MQKYIALCLTLFAFLGMMGQTAQATDPVQDRLIKESAVGPLYIRVANIATSTYVKRWEGLNLSVQDTLKRELAYYNGVAPSDSIVAVVVDHMINTGLLIEPVSSMSSRGVLLAVWRYASGRQEYPVWVGIVGRLVLAENPHWTMRAWDEKNGERNVLFLDSDGAYILVSMPQSMSHEEISYHWPVDKVVVKRMNVIYN